MPGKIHKTKVVLKRKKKIFWTEEHIEEAIHELESVLGSSKRNIAKKFGFDESTLRFRLKRRDANLALKKPGRK